MIKWVCVECHYVNKGILTPGKVYEFTKETEYDPFTNIDIISIISFIGDDGKSYLVNNDDKDFITLEEHRNKQLEKYLN
mgnify:CR=1 FL=1